MPLMIQSGDEEAEAAWTPPAGVKAWLSYYNSGPVGAGGTWADAVGAYDMTLLDTSSVTSDGLVVVGAAGKGASRAAVGLLADQWTLALWVKDTASGLGRWSWGSYAKYASYRTAYGEYIKGGPHGTVYVTSGAWHHIVWQYNGTVYRASRDGEAWVTLWTSTSIGGDYTFYLGQEPTDGPMADARIDDVFIADSALSDADILSIRTLSPGKRG